MKCSLSIHGAIVGIAAAVAGCSGPPEQNLLPDTFAGERGAVSQGRLHAETPFPLQAVVDRPIDLGRLTREQAENRLAVSDDRTPNGRKDLPWLGQPAEATPDGDFNPVATPFWAAQLPAWAELDLARLCYVSAVVVEPYSQEFGATEYSVSLIGGDGAEISVASNVHPAAENVALGSAVPPAAMVASFPPRVAQHVRIRFTKGGTSQEPNVYIRRIRVLGVPMDGPFAAAPADVAEPLFKALDANRQDLTVFAPDGAAAQVNASGELRAGSAMVPFLESSSPTDYWAAMEPAAITVDLGKPCYVDQVVVWPLSESHGARRYYVKVITDDGSEVDTAPPADVSAPEVTAPGSGFRPQPLAAAFEPVLVQKLRLYFPQGGFATSAIYVRRIQVQGIPALE